MTEAKPTVGQVWREVDPRKDRYVRIITVYEDWATIETVEWVEWRSEWMRVKATRTANADLDWFDGRRGGYAYNPLWRAGKFTNQTGGEDR